MCLMTYFLKAQYSPEAMISHEHKFIFIHIPKCGGQTIETAFNVWDNPDLFLLEYNRQHWKLKKSKNFDWWAED